MPSPLDDHIRSLLDRVRVTVSGQLEADLSASTADILRAVAEEHRRAIIDATERTATETRLEAEGRLAVAREEFEREREERRQSAASEVSGLEQTLGDVRGELDAARRSLDALQSARDVLEQELEHIKQDWGERRRELEEAVERATRENEQTRQESDAAVRELERVRNRLAQTTRLASAFRTLDEATSLGDILEHLAESACQEAGRTAVFLVNGQKLRAWRAMGFEATDEPIVGAISNLTTLVSWVRRLDWAWGNSTETVTTRRCRPLPQRMGRGTPLLSRCRSVDRLLPCCMRTRRGPIVRKNLNGWI